MSGHGVDTSCEGETDMCPHAPAQSWRDCRDQCEQSQRWNRCAASSPHQKGLSSGCREVDVGQWCRMGRGRAASMLVPRDERTARQPAPVRPRVAIDRRRCPHAAPTCAPLGLGRQCACKGGARHCGSNGSKPPLS
jgi:hypothetical protein